uniref:Uncharacterized protein n=1 Tax=Romanomermis culicivorax TaxID=13658 RepID=A0A915J9G2_ROMCU
MRTIDSRLTVAHVGTRALALSLMMKHVFISLLNVEKLINSQKMLCNEVALLLGVTAMTEDHRLSNILPEKFAIVVPPKSRTLNDNDIEVHIDCHGHL